MKADRHAKIVIIGAGAVGCAIAYHLARMGERDVLVLEKAQITHGSTWHAAGLVGQLRGKRALTRLMQNSVAVFDRLGAESGMATDWKKVGSLRLAASEARWSEIRRSIQLAKSFGFEAHQVSPAEAKRMFPHIDPKGVVGAAWIPSDGYIDPYAVTTAFAASARKGGVRIEEGVTVTAIPVAGRRALGVVTDHGTIAAEIVVNAAGYWARRVGAMAGVPVAAGVVEHQYFVTEKGLDFPADLTTLRDPDHNFYLKPDVGGSWAIGGWEEGTRAPWNQWPPFDFARELFPADMDRLELFALPAAERLPVLNEIGIKTVINGPIPVSADGEPIMGLAPELDNFYLACGFTAGIAASGGAGEAMANWIVNGDPGLDLWPFDTRRFGAPHARAAWLSARAVEAYAAYYKIHWPGEEKTAGRGLRRSPLYAPLKEAGAVFGSRFGWERANWFRSSDPDATDTPSFEGKPGWHGAVAAEVAAIRGGVALIDQSSFSKFELKGPGARAALDRIAAAAMPEAPGRAIYTQLLNARGGIEADLTILSRGEDDFLIVTGSGFGVRDAGWIGRQLPKGLALRDVTNAFAVLNLCGPRAREVLAGVTDADISNAAFPFLAARDIAVGMAEALAVRVGYVGELGWELYVPVDYGAHVYEVLKAAGAAAGIRDAGYRAIESCRLEKGYLYWSADISPETTPAEAGLGFAVAMDKGDFTGRAALAAAGAPSRRLVTLSVAGFAPFLSGETVLHAGRPVASLTSAGYGHHLGRTIGFCYLPAALAGEQGFTIEAFGTAYEAVRGPRCLYDARMERLKS
ncbi:MAG: FAD-dependent oxidoreductase [Defluviimonas sp.]|uniref:GcvT family protein n=1 Tax=Albidovulum sp. TaxID=1872424 RepID=UPI001DC3D7EA|nr:FAD-dependent oxidoreductase [Paracoccaceae bacterium]MCC0064350.1 FAD-dependent oxidoreductase [Defluviimonas sp.]